MIEHGIPIPPPRTFTRQHPFHELKVGESFHTESPSAYQLVGNWNRKLAPKRFACRKQEEGFRIWRIA